MMSFFTSSPVVSPPSVAIREANTHIQTLFDENQRLEKEIEDLRVIVERKQEREHELLDIEEELRVQVASLQSVLNEQKVSFQQEKTLLLDRISGTAVLEEKDCEEKADAEKVEEAPAPAAPEVVEAAVEAEEEVFGGESTLTAESEDVDEPPAEAEETEQAEVVETIESEPPAEEAAVTEGEETIADATAEALVEEDAVPTEGAETVAEEAVEVAEEVAEAAVAEVAEAVVEVVAAKAAKKVAEVAETVAEVVETVSEVAETVVEAAEAVVDTKEEALADDPTPPTETVEIVEEATVAAAEAVEPVAEAADPTKTPVEAAVVEGEAAVPIEGAVVESERVITVEAQLIDVPEGDRVITVQAQLLSDDVTGSFTVIEQNVVEQEEIIKEGVEEMEKEAEVAKEPEEVKKPEEVVKVKESVPEMVAEEKAVSHQVLPGKVLLVKDDTVVEEEVKHEEPVVVGETKLVEPVVEDTKQEPFAAEEEVQIVPVSPEEAEDTEIEIEKLQLTIQEQSEKILTLESEINRLVLKNDKEVGELKKQVDILQEIMKYKSAVKNVTICLEEAEQLLAASSIVSDSSTQSSLDVETNV